MNEKISRRQLIKGAAFGAAALSGARIFDAPYIIAAEPNKKLRCAIIGCGGRGESFHIPSAAKEKIVALVEPDPKNLQKALARAKKEGQNPDEIKTFADYRKFFEAMKGEVDAVFTATPNHHHALVSMLAMENGMGIYVEKPMSYDIAEARMLAEASKKYKVATQMGNQGHSGEGYRRLVEYIQAGAIGNVTEVYHWCDAVNGGVGPRPAPMPPPNGMDWDAWIGPAPYVDYHPDYVIKQRDGKEKIMPLHPHEWHGWHAYGGGAMGNRGCHIMDGAHWALNLNGPCKITLEDNYGGTDERFPFSSIIRWDYPQRGDLAPVKVWWYDGKKRGATSDEPGDFFDSAAPADRVKPPILIEMEKKYGKDRFEGNATLYVGDKGMMYTGFYGGGVRILPEELHKATPVPEAKFERIKGSHPDDFLRGVRDPSYKPCSNFEVAAPLTELTLLGVLAIKAGKGNTIEWDGDKSTNIAKINDYIKRDYREGWKF